jgi:hypothetical protein
MLFCGCRFVRQTAEVENLMVSVERMLEYTGEAQRMCHDACSAWCGIISGIILCLHWIGLMALRCLRCHASTAASSALTLLCLPACLPACLPVYVHCPDLPSEPPLVKEGGGTPPAGWPRTGTIRYEGVTASYRPGLPPVLRDLTFNLQVLNSTTTHS